MKKEVIEKLSFFITSAFGLVSALAWNSAIQQIFTYFFKSSGGLLYMLLYALFVTVIAVVVTIWIGKISEKVK